MLFIVLNLGSISYGHGLGDLFYHAIALAAFTIITILFVIGLKKKSVDDVLFILMFVAIVLTIVLLTLKFTIYRGPEYRWNGNVFYG